MRVLYKILKINTLRQTEISCPQCLPEKFRAQKLGLQCDKHRGQDSQIVFDTQQSAWVWRILCAQP